MSEASELCLEKVQHLHVNAFKYYLPSLHKSSLTTRQIMLKLTESHGFLPNFQLEHAVKVTATIICTQN